MGSYMSKNNQNSQSFISYETLLWLKKQVWAWILLGIFIMSVFFYIAKGLIVFIGGIALGVYLYNKYGKYEKDNSGNSGGNTANNANNNSPHGVGEHQKALPFDISHGALRQGEQIFSNTMGFVKSGMMNMLPKQENFINFNENKLFNNMWWKNTR